MVKEVGNVARKITPKNSFIDLLFEKIPCTASCIKENNVLCIKENMNAAISIYKILAWEATHKRYQPAIKEIKKITIFNFAGIG